VKVVYYQNKILGTCDDDFNFASSSGQGFMVFNQWFSSIKVNNVFYIQISDQEFIGMGEDNGIKENYEINNSGELVRRFDYAIKVFRKDRDDLLEKSDRESKIIWKDLWDSLDDETKTAWTTYRENLRNAPEEFGDVEEIDNYIWPTKPS